MLVVGLKLFYWLGVRVVYRILLNIMKLVLILDLFSVSLMFFVVVVGLVVRLLFSVFRDSFGILLLIVSIMCVFLRVLVCVVVFLISGFVFGSGLLFGFEFDE